MADPAATKVPSTQQSDELAPSPFLSLPQELRDMVYDQLFDTLTHDRKVDLERYQAADEWPSNDFTDYRNLRLVCKQIDHEAKKRWQKEYSKRCTFYTHCVPTLHRFLASLQNSGIDYSEFRYVLRTRPTRIIDYDMFRDYNWEFHEAGDHLIEDQPSFQDSPPGGFANLHELRIQLARDGITPYSSPHYPEWNLHAHFQADGGVCVCLPRPAYDGNRDCQIRDVWWWGRERHDSDEYRSMHGKIAQIDWSWYFATDTWAQMRIWNEWVRRGSRLIRKRKLLILAWWRDESKRDKHWEALGGRWVGELQEIAEQLGMRRWLLDDLSDVPAGWVRAERDYDFDDHVFCQCGRCECRYKCGRCDTCDPDQKMVEWLEYR